MTWATETISSLLHTCLTRRLLVSLLSLTQTRKSFGTLNLSFFSFSVAECFFPLPKAFSGLLEPGFSCHAWL